MAQTLNDLPVGAKVKAKNSKWYGKDLIFRKLGAGHSQDPVDSVILQTNDIITVRCFDAKEPNSSNNNRKKYGNNWYLHSNLLQWLNSDAGANAWYSAQHTEDQKPDEENVMDYTNPYDTQAGFMNGFTADFKNSLLTVSKRTVKPSTDGGGYEDVESKFFLLSTTEVGLADENNIAEGELYSLFNDETKRIMVPTQECVNNSVGCPITVGSAYRWWLRTPYSSCYTYDVNTNGTIRGDYSYDGRWGVAPACAISKDQKVSDSVDSDGCYTLIYREPISKPTMSTTSYKATKSEITPKLDGYDASTMTLSGDTSATNIGFYTLSITPKEGYGWSDDDSATNPVNFVWDIYDVGVIKRNNIVYGDTSELEENISELRNEINNLIDNNSSLPNGGTTGQILAKTSDTDGEAEWQDIELGNKVSVEPKVSEGVNIASITIDGHTTQLFAPEGSSEPSTITVVNPNLYDVSAAVKGSGNDYNIYSEISVSPNTDYVFDIQNSPYGWAGVRVGNTTIGNNAPDRKTVEFNSGSNTTVRTQFFPGNDTTVAQTDFSNILFYEAGKIPGETTTIENPNSGSGSNLISTDITEILLTASSQHPIEIVLIGDSITEGYSATGSLNAGSTHPLPTWASFPSWAGKLNSYITANFPNVTVTNRGYSGQVSSYGASNINSWITNNRQIAIVMFGTNNRTTQANMDSLANDYTTMLNRCKSVGAKMIPMCCIPTTPYNQSISGKYVGTMEQVHNILVNWAKTNGYELLDLYSLMMAYINNNTSNLETMGLIYVGSADNNLHIHPSDAGHAVMFDFIKHKLGIGTAGGSGGGAKYRHRVAMYCLNGGTTYVVVNLYNNRSTPYNAATTTTTDEINTFKADVLAAGYSSALQKGTLMCSGVIKGTNVYGMYMGTSSSGLSAVADKLNFIDGTNFNVTLPLETGGTNSASSSLRLWDTVEPV